MTKLAIIWVTSAWVALSLDFGLPLPMIKAVQEKTTIVKTIPGIYHSLLKVNL